MNALAEPMFSLVIIKESEDMKAVNNTQSTGEISTTAAFGTIVIHRNQDWSPSQDTARWLRRTCPGSAAVVCPALLYGSWMDDSQDEH